MRSIIFFSPQEQKKKQHIHSRQVSQLMTELWPQLIVMMIDLCSPREGLLYYSSYKFVGCWTFCEAPLCDPGNVHWCHCEWSSRAGVSSFLFQSSLLAECSAKRNILYTQIWAIQKVVQHIISLGVHLESSVLKQKAEMSLGSSCRKTWALTHQLKFTLWKLWLWK